jgi:Tfp pilus assembly protein PilV
MIYNKKGQSLIDIVVSLGLLVVIITALSIATINGLRNSQFSRNQTQATKLAQDTMEKIRLIKNNNYGVCINNVTPCGTWNDLWNTTLGRVSTSCVDCKFKLDTAGCTIVGASLRPLCLSESSAAVTISGIFSQEIFLEDEYVGQNKLPGQLRATVQVSWTDTSGPHESVLSTLFTNH